MVEHKLEWVAVFADRVVALAKGEVIADGETLDVLCEEGRVFEIIGETRYTQAARRARQIGIWPPDRGLPVTLGEAAEGFLEARRLHAKGGKGLDNASEPGNRRRGEY
jgi:energy-coupling factor transporter ATP-binding protein EcfA2